MKRMKLTKLITGLLLVFGMSEETLAGIIIASGDATPAYYATNPGNSTFFANILQGGSNVFVHDLYGPSIGNNLVSYYNTLTGSSNGYLGDTTISASSLTGVDLFVTGLASNAFDSGELTALDSFVDAGGSVLFMGDYTSVETWINDALAYLDSGMSLYSPISDPGTHQTTSITSDPLTAGVSEFTYGATYGVSGGTALFFDTSGRPILAYEGYSKPQTVPEPSMAILFGTGLAGLFGSRNGAAKRRNPR